MKHLIQSVLLTFLILSASCSGEKNNDAATRAGGRYLRLRRDVGRCCRRLFGPETGKSVLLVGTGQILGTV